MNIFGFIGLLGMRLKHTVIIGFIALLISTVAQAQTGSISVDHREWVEREVASLIGDAEKDYFLSLRNEKDRENFIEAFWRVYDPTPGTVRNEFQEEYQRRLAEVNRRFGNMLWPGIATARGKVYLRLGEPVQVVSYDSPELTSYMEAWLYPPDRSVGFHYNFYILFYRPESKGDLEPFCPGKDEPHLLLASHRNGEDPVRQEEALRKLFELDPLLGQLSLSMLPIEHRPIMINNRFDLRRALSRRSEHSLKMIKTLLAGGNVNSRERLAEIRAIMQGDTLKPKVRYMKARMNIPYRFHVLRGENGVPRLLFSFALDSKRVKAIDSYGKCYALLEVDVRVMDESDVLVKEKEDTITATLDLWNVHNGSPGDIIHQDFIDLPPGNYRVEADVRSPLDGMIYTFGDRVTVPNMPTNRLQLSEPVLLLADVNTSAVSESNPYTIFEEEVFPANEQQINKGKDAIFYYQLYFPRRDRTSSVDVRYILRAGNKVLWQDEERLYRSSLRPGSFFSKKIKIPSAAYSPGVYSIEIVAKALSPPEARVSADFTVRNDTSNRTSPTLASIEQ